MLVGQESLYNLNDLQQRTHAHSARASVLVCYDQISLDDSDSILVELNLTFR